MKNRFAMGQEVRCIRPYSLDYNLVFKVIYVDGSTSPGNYWYYCERVGKTIHVAEDELESVPHVRHSRHEYHDVIKSYITHYSEDMYYYCRTCKEELFNDAIPKRNIKLSF